MKDNNNRILVLDSLRGLAALGVALFCHYRHFSQPFGVSVLKNSPFINSQPFNWLYIHSWVLVDFFFVLSGYIFSACYLKRLQQQDIRPYDFFILRASRLYPLHIITLILAAIGFWLYMAVAKLPSFPYHYDTYHLLLNILFIQKGFIDKGFSFNAPAWSLSVEAFSYVVFYILATKTKNFIGWAILAIIVGLIILQGNYNLPFINTFIARSLIGFFSGCVTYYLLTSHYKIVFSIIMFSCSIYLLSTLMITGQYDYAFYFEIPSYSLILFPTLLITMLEINWLRTLFEIKPLTHLGDISYSVYLIQLPLQLFMQSYCAINKVTIPVSSPWFLIFYGCLLIVLATISYKYIEVPLRKWVRKRFYSKSSSKSVQHPSLINSQVIK